MIEHKTSEPEDTTTIVMSRDAIDALRRFVDLIAGGEGVIQLEPASEPEPEPDVPVWPSAPYVMHEGYVWGCDEDGGYHRADGGDTWAAYHMEGEHIYSSGIRTNACRFAREAVPVTLVPTEAWEAWLNALPDPANDADDDLVQAVDPLAQEVAR